MSIGVQFTSKNDNYDNNINRLCGILLLLLMPIYSHLIDLRIKFDIKKVAFSPKIGATSNKNYSVS